VLDGNRETYWSTPDGTSTPTLTLELKPGTRFDVIRLREYLPLGVRVTRFAVDAEIDGTWQQLAEKQCISAQRILRLPRPIAPRRVRLRILEAPACPAIAEFALFRAVAPVPVAPIVSSDPTVIDTRNWKIVAASGPGAETLLDRDPGTIWTTPAPRADAPTGVTIDLGTATDLAGFSLTPSRHVMIGAAPPKGYVAETSIDGTNWVPAAAGEFSNIAYALSTQRIGFAEARTARYLRLRFAEAALPEPKLAIAEIGGFTRPR
jgi:alpha-L-fucosidase